MKKQVLFIDFSNNKNNKKTISYLHKKLNVKIDVYDVFESKSVKRINVNEYNGLILGGGKDTISIDRLLNSHNKTVATNPLYEVYDIIKLFNNLPILGIGYGCNLLGSFYGCRLHKLEVENNEKMIGVRFDNRYKIHTEKNNNSLMLFNNKYIIDDSMCSNVKSIAKTIHETKMMNIGFRFMNKEHYGYTCRLIHHKYSYGKHIIQNFISILVN